MTQGISEDESSEQSRRAAIIMTSTVDALPPPPPVAASHPPPPPPNAAPEVTADVVPALAAPTGIDDNGSGPTCANADDQASGGEEGRSPPSSSRCPPPPIPRDGGDDDDESAGPADGHRAVLADANAATFVSPAIHLGGIEVPPPNHASSSSSVPVKQQQRGLAAVDYGMSPSPPFFSSSSSYGEGGGGEVTTGTAHHHHHRGGGRLKPPCSYPSCANRSIQGGVCVAHGARRPVCNAEGCDKAVKVGGYCSTHGPARRGCDDPGCTRVAVQGGKCVAHGARRPAKRRHEDPVRDEAGLLGNLFYSSADAASSLASDEEMDEDVDARGDDDDDDDDDDVGEVEDEGTGEVFARAAGTRDGASSTRRDEEEEDPSDSSEDGVDEFLDEILKKRKDAIEREARAEDDGEQADPPPPRVGGTGQARGGDDIPREVGEKVAEQLVPQRIVPTHGRWGEDEVEDMDSDDGGEEENNEDDATRKPRIFTAPTSVERGVTCRPSGKWQVQLYYAGSSRYIGLFDSKEEASLAYEIARDCMNSFKEADPSPEQIKRNLYVMRNAILQAKQYNSTSAPTATESNKRLPPKYIHPDPVDYRRTGPGWFNQRPRSPTATEYYSAMQHRNGKAALRPHQRDQEMVFDLDEWEAARGTKRADAAEKASQLRAKTDAAEKASQLGAKDWQKKTWKKHCKARDSLDAKEKRANEVLAALESAKRSSTATPAPVAADAGSEKSADRAPSPPAVARTGAHSQNESRDGSKEDNLLSYLLALSAKPSSPDPVHHPDHESHLMSNYDHDTAILHSETVANSASDSWKTSDDFENASISVSSSNDSPDSVSSGKKRKDRSGHPKLNQLAVDYLRSWLLSRQHIEQPYPSEQNYADLSRATGLEKPQLKNWFVNNRRRLWRPMMNELRKRHGLAERDPLPCEVLDTLPDAPRHPYDDISSIYCPSQAPEDRPRPPLQIGSQSELFQAPEVTPLSVAPTVAMAALQPQDHEDAISSAADSVAAAAMMLMTGGRARSPAKNAMNGVECIDSVDQDGNSNEPKELSQRVVTSPVIEAKASKLSTSWQVRSFPLWNAENSPPKEQVKFNLGGTVVQVPTEILLKHEGSKIAAITRSAMRVGDMAIPLPRDYEMFCHCVFYVCNEKVQLPPSVRRKDFMKEMKYYGIPFDETLVSGGKCASPNTSTSKLHSSMSLPRQQQISPTTVTQLHYHAAAAPAPGPHQPGLIASKVGAPGEPRMPSPLDLLSSAMSSFIGTSSRPTSPAPDHHHPGLYGGSPFDRNDCQFVANGGALGDPTKQTFLSPLDLLSSAISSTDSSWRSKSASYATQQERNPNVRKAMCGRCEVCLRDDCGECNFCLDKPKFGGPNRLRKKCLMRRCPNMNPVPTFDASFYASATSKLLAIDGSESPVEDGKIMALQRSVVEAEKRWAENLEFLRPCIEDGGLINYAVIPDDEIRSRVKNFVKECRKQHRRIENNESTSLTEERLRLLEEANFPWSHTPYAKNLGLEVLEMKPTSSLDLLCSITSQSFEEAGSWGDDGIDDEDAHNEEEAEREVSEEAEEATSRLPTTKRVRGLNCGTCANCQRDDCGKCRACIDKPKFGGPNKSRRRCFHRRCLIRKKKLDEKPSAMEVDTIPLEQNKTVNRNGQRKPGGNHRSEEERMRAELANIRAELDAKARGVKYGLKIRSIPTIENLAREIEDEESEDEASADEVEDMDSDDGGEEENNEDDATRKPRIFTAPTSVERGVTVRPSGKWQVQLYYAGNSRYIGLFDSKEEASSAYEIARDCMSSFKETDPSPEQIKRNLDVMRKAAFSGGTYRSSRVEESKQVDRKKIAAEDKSRRANVVQALSDLKRSQHVIRVKVEADLNAKAKSSKQDIKFVRPKNLPKASKPDNTTREVVMENVPDESRKRKFGSDIYEKAKTLAEALPRGITVRPSGKWQVQLYYAGKSRYIGVFETKIDAAVAYELARDCFGAFKDDDPSPEQAKKNVMLMRKAAFAPFQACQVDNGKRKYSKKAKVEDEGESSKNQNTEKAVFTLDEWKAAYPMKKSDAVNAKTSPVISAETTSRTSPRRGVEEHEQKDEASKALTTPTTPSLALVAADVGVRRSRIIKDFPEVGPGWNYFSPTGQRVRSLKEAKAKAQEIEQVLSSSDTESSSDKVYRNVKDGDFGVGYKFRKNFIDESGTDLGWFEGEVVDILSDTDKDRKCFYAANGHIEDLCIAELESCARLESKSMDSIGSVGYQFKKQFDGKWFDGVVVKIVNTDNDKDRRCHYPEDDDFEDLSMADLRRLAELEEKRDTVTEAADEIHHNDLCETCGKPGELLCCSTCNLVFHLGCTRPKLVQVPECDWSCAFCVTAGDIVKSTSKQERNEARIAVREIEALKEEVRSEELRRRKSPRKRKHTMDS